MSLGSVASPDDLQVKLRYSLKPESLLDSEYEVAEEYDSLLLRVILNESALECGQTDVATLCLGPKLLHYLLKDLIGALYDTSPTCISYSDRVS